MLAAAFAVAILACAAADAAASRAIHKCIGADGKTVFSDAACPGEVAGDDEQGASPPTSSGRTQDGGAAAAKKDAPSAAQAAGLCPSWEPPEGQVAVDPPRKIDPADLPHDASGRPVQILVSKRGPTSTAAECSAMVSACSQKSADPGGSIDICFKSAPRCATGRPWEEDKPCCPDACWQKYANLRRQCVNASTASYKSLFESRCVTDSSEANVEAAP